MVVVTIKTVAKHAKVKSNPQHFETLLTKSHKRTHVYNNAIIEYKVRTHARGFNT